MLGGIDDAECSPHANTHQIDFGNMVLLTDKVDGVVHITVDMIINGQEPVLARGVAPVHHIQIDALPPETF